MLPNYALLPTLDKDEVPTEPAESETDENLATPKAELQDDEVLEAEAALTHENSDDVTEGYVIAISKNGRCRRLHCLEACRLKPGVHYKHFEVYGDALPEDWEVNAVCKHCLPGGPPRAEEAGSESDSASSSTSSGG